MTMILLCFLSVNPFYDANFTSLPIRSLAVFSNPAGTGFQSGAEYFFAYQPHEIVTATSLGSVGIGMTKIDSITYYEAGLGLKLPGAFSLGYAYQFDLKDYDISHHIIGIMCQPNQYVSLGYKTTISERNHMFGGLSVRPYKEYLTLSLDLEYEGVDSIFNYYYGGALQPISGIKMNFRADQDFNWHAGLEVSFGQVVIAGDYSSADKKFGGGIILSAQSYKTFVPPPDKMTSLTLSGDYPELERKSFLGVPFGTKQGFTKLLNDLKSLHQRKDIKVVLVELKNDALGPAQREELRGIFLDIKNSGKKIICFADNYKGLFSYELACVADEIILAPAGTLVIPGVAMRSVYIKNALNKLGMETDVVALGKYKSFSELFLRTNMSEEDREQSEKYLDDIYDPILDNIAAARDKTRQEVEEIINQYAYLNSDDALSLRLVDKLLYSFELKEYLTEKYGRMGIAKLEDLVNEKHVDEGWHKVRPKIALVIAEGAIVPGAGKPSFFTPRLIGGDQYAQIFEALSKDRSIEAVVFRINSGGGDGFASEEIAHAVRRCAQYKPVIVTMGDVAGSGGYLMSCLADKIYADNRTITGSIGVVSLKLINKGLYDKLGISWDYVKRGEHADAFWDLRHFTDEELARADQEVGWWYDRFTNSVAMGRNMAQGKVDSLGQGRIYSGRHAREIKLTDEVGGYLAALDWAKKITGIEDDAELVVYPRHLGFSLLDNSDAKSSIVYLMPEYVIE